MRSFRIVFNQRAASVFAAAALIFATLIPSLVSAATVTSRSIALSNSTKATSGVTYHVVFTSPGTTQDFVIDFCDSAALNTTCNTPTGFTASSSTTATSGYTRTVVDANTVTVTLGTPGTSIDMELADVTNPTNAGVFYARITTYAGSESYNSATDLGSYVDNGGVAMYATDGFGVDGRVAETMVFCAANSADTIGTGCSGTLTSPSFSLGASGVLSSASVSTGTVKTQISTNAVGGAVVYLKSNTAGCGGLLREGTGTAADRCGIAPLTGTPADITAGNALFGLKLAGLGGASSTTTAAAGSYGTTNYFMNYDTDNNDSEGVTGPYGDPIYNTSGDPVSDGTANLVFGASISNLTPAGTYRAQFNLIATGTF